MLSAILLLGLYTGWKQSLQWGILHYHLQYHIYEIEAHSLLVNISFSIKYPNE